MFLPEGVDVADEGREEQWGPQHTRHHAERRHHPRHQASPPVSRTVFGIRLDS